MNNEMINVVQEGEELVVSSREVAENFGKEHGKVIRSINEIITGIERSSQKWRHLFIESEYVNEQNKQVYKEYLMNRDGFSLLVMGFTGKKAIEWKMKYIEAFNKMEEHIKQQKTPQIPNKILALMGIIEAEDDLSKTLAIKEYEKVVTTPLLQDIDKYKRFLGEELTEISKSELAERLDTKPQTIASLFKKIGVYTQKKSSLSVHFLNKYPNTKICKTIESGYYHPTTGDYIEKSDWIWTSEGAVKVIEHLAELGLVVQCLDNSGFKLAEKKDRDKIIREIA